MEETMRWPVLVLVLLALCACGGSEPPGRSTDEYAPNEGANATVNDMVLRNAFAIGAKPGQALRKGDDVPLYFVLVNDRRRPDELVSVSAKPMFSGATISGQKLLVRTNELVGGGAAPQVVLTGLAEELRSGSFIPVTFTFKAAGPLKTLVPVLPPTQWRATLSPAPQSSG
jgi:predicted small lipoprotein YifL